MRHAFEVSCVEELGTQCIFENRWWLDAVHDGEVRILEVIQNQTIVARMAVPLSKKLGLVIVRQPPLTQTLGPWVLKVSDNPSKQLAFEKSALTNLIKQMPTIDFHSINFHHSRGNWLPFFWAGFCAVPRITYLLDDLTDMEKLWKRLQGSVRSDVKKAHRLVQCEETDDIEVFLSVYHKTFERQGRTPPQADAIVRRLDAACAERKCRRILIARDAAGHIHAGAYIVWDSRSAYYLMGGGDPDLRKSGAGSMLIWESIKFAATVTRQFDFEGSMSEPIEHFFRSFGGRQATYINVRRTRPLVRYALLAKEALFLLRGR